MYCASLGYIECLKILLYNPEIDVDAICEASGVNAFWIAAFYGRAKCMNLLANAKINILVKTKLANENALHIALH